jgi:hypothetical protein
MYLTMYYTLFVAALLRNYKRTFGKISAEYIADVFRRSALSGMTEIPAEILAHTLTEIRRMEKTGVVSSLTMPADDKDLLLYIPKVTLAPLVKSGVVDASEVTEIEGFNNRHADKRDAYKMAVKASVTVSKVRATISALENGTIKIF